MNRRQKKYRLVIAGLALLVFILWTIYGLDKRKKLVKYLHGEAFSGTIIRYKDLKKMTYEVWLSNSDTSYDIPGFATYKNDIRIGDSLFKRKNSKQIYYYKKTDQGEFYYFDMFEIK